MRALAGSILLLAAAVLYSAYWLGRVMHRSVNAGSEDAMNLLGGAVMLGLLAAPWSRLGWSPTGNTSHSIDGRSESDV